MEDWDFGLLGYVGFRIGLRFRIYFEIFGPFVFRSTNLFFLYKIRVSRVNSRIALVFRVRAIRVDTYQTYLLLQTLLLKFCL